MTTTHVDRLFAAALFLLGLHIVWNAIDYGYMRGATPGPGFFPFWVGLGLTILSAVNVVRSLTGRESLDSQFDRQGLLKAAAIIGAVIVFIVLTPWVGLLAGTGLLIPAIAFVIRPGWTPAFAGTILVIAVAFPVACYYLFGVYLQVPLVTGVFGF